MYDHERSLVQKLAGKPFALIGVNTDDNLETLRQVVKDKQLTWRSFWDGKDFSISKGYGVSSFPTVLILDKDGVVRYQVRAPKEIDKAIDTLLAEMGE